MRLPKKHNDFSTLMIVMSIYAAILFALNVIRIFDNNFWGDEAFTTTLVAKNISEIIPLTAADVHPPLYYLIAKLGYMLVGDQGWMWHLISLLPCAITLVLALTFIWNKFSKETSIILITLATISENAVDYNVEVRMYSWGALFVLLSFLFLYLILNDEKNTDYALFTIFSLAAAYTHYYCLVSVAFFYVGLLVLAFFTKKVSWKKVLTVCVCTVAAYLPWFFKMLNSMLVRVDNYWIASVPSFKSSLVYLFSGLFDKFLWIGLCVVAAIVFLYETNLLSVEPADFQKRKIRFSFENFHASTDLIWMICGGVSVIGTIAFGILISAAIRPFYILRYIYPVSIVAWVILGCGISKLKSRKLVTAVLIAYMLVAFLPSYYTKYADEKASNEKLQATLAATTSVIEAEDVILTNNRHMDWTILKYYYPGVESVQVDLLELPDLDADTCYWLIISGEQEMSDVYRQIEEQGLYWTQIIDAGNLGTHTVYIYRISCDE